MTLSSKNSQNQNKEKAISLLRALGQEKLLAHWSNLTTQQRQHLIDQIAAIDAKLFARQKAAIFHQEEASCPSIEPFKNYSHEGNPKDLLLGNRLVQAGKTALIALAGGQGSRLKFEGPKGCYPVTLVKHKSLFQLLTEKVKAASVQADRPLELAIMTSPLNNVQTKKLFLENGFFGLDQSQVTFFCQPMWPLLNFAGDLFLEEVDQIAQGPNGNGSLFRSLEQAGILEKWLQKGIEMVQIVPIDNPLAKPFDHELFGFHEHYRNTVSMRASLRAHAQENVGVLASAHGNTRIIEYLDLNAEQKEAKDRAGNFKFGIANLGLFCFSLTFMKRIAVHNLPLHKAMKAVKMLQQDHTSQMPDKPNAWKFEEFIFDVLPFAEKVAALLTPRGHCFAPLKNLQGEASIESVRADLLAFDRQIFAQITGSEAPKDAIFELAPQFHYPTEKLLKKWRGKPFPNKDYIDE